MANAAWSSKTLLSNPSSITMLIEWKAAGVGLRSCVWGTDVTIVIVTQQASSCTGCEGRQRQGHDDYLVICLARVSRRGRALPAPPPPHPVRPFNPGVISP
ncbi:hypothetical protein J6590_018067 [Homalodisca vitripennis]|nr:hypothetical protein J6590_018067 [Homalodisca vitripennis]